jgi:hypothetical protein
VIQSTYEFITDFERNVASIFNSDAFTATKLNTVFSEDEPHQLVKNYRIGLWAREEVSEFHVFGLQTFLSRCFTTYKLTSWFTL